jgi:hypothetical protein
MTYLPWDYLSVDQDDHNDYSRSGYGEPETPVTQPAPTRARRLPRRPSLWLTP